MSPAGLPWDHPDADPMADIRNYIAEGKAQMSQPSITCPKCGRTSWNANDIHFGYCGNCHDWTSGGMNVPIIHGASQLPLMDCPECACGKHGNCDSSTWDDTRDAPGVCPCFEKGHPS